MFFLFYYKRLRVELIRYLLVILIRNKFNIVLIRVFYLVNYYENIWKMKLGVLEIGIRLFSVFEICIVNFEFIL